MVIKLIWESPNTQESCNSRHRKSLEGGCAIVGRCIVVMAIIIFALLKQVQVIELNKSIVLIMGI